MFCTGVSREELAELGAIVSVSIGPNGITSVWRATGNVRFRSEVAACVHIFCVCVCVCILILDVVARFQRELRVYTHLSLRI